MAKSTKRSTAQSLRAKRATDVSTARTERAQEENDRLAKENAPAVKAREIRNEALRKSEQERRDRMIDLAADEEKASEPKKAAKPHLLDGKPGSGAGLKPGDLYAPKSNPGAAAAVPMQPLSPDSKQSHGKGILFDKDLDNGAFATGDPEEIDAPPSGSHPRAVDKGAEVKKADKATSRFKQSDPDNPSIGYKGKDATASPEPIGHRHRSKNAIAGGSNSGIDE